MTSKRPAQATWRRPSLEEVLAQCRSVQLVTTDPPEIRKWLVEANRQEASGILSEATDRLRNLGCDPEAWRVLRVREDGPIAWGEEKAKAALGGDIREVRRKGKQGRIRPGRLERIWNAAEAGALADYALRTDDPVDMQAAVRRARQRFADDTARGRKILQSAQEGGAQTRKFTADKVPAIVEAALGYLRSNPTAQCSRVAQHLDEQGFGNFNTLRRHLPGWLAKKTPPHWRRRGRPRG